MADYQNIGLKCGLEIHQQLEGKKLFCNCPTLLRDDAPNFTIRRKLRASAGETGAIDIASQQEQLKELTFVYEGYQDTTCLVEADCEPPHEINKEALYTVLQFCKLVQANVSPLVQVMRKIITNGSVTSGFQRTALIARGGLLQTSGGEVRIANINLEEDAAKDISETPTEKTYRLDRLGIPLIEIGTEPDIKTPQQAQETAKKIGYLLRSLPGVKRGLGTIRQDINVSIAGGSRIEIKGAQDLALIPALIDLEIKRQEELLKIKEELTRQKVQLNALKVIDLTEWLKNSTSKIIAKTILSKGKILAFKLNGFAGYIGRELQPNYRLGTEFSGRARIKAGVGGIFHSDELPNYGITAPEIALIIKELNCSEKDAFILVAAEEKKAKLALETVYERAKEIFQGVPKEVRKANPDGTTSFMRPMPGAARMYPETDVPLVRPMDLKKVEVPETLEEKMLRYQQKLGLGKDLAEFVAKSEKMLLFEELAEKYPLSKFPQIKPAFIAEILTSVPLGLKRDFGIEPEKLTEEHFRNLFFYLSEDKIHKDIIFDVLIEMSKSTFNLEKYAGLSTEELHQEIKKIVEENRKGNVNASFSALMGLCVKRLAGKASGKIISDTLKMILEKA